MSATDPKITTVEISKDEALLIDEFIYSLVEAEEKKDKKDRAKIAELNDWQQRWRQGTGINDRIV
jgi:hypothetical protein